MTPTYKISNTATPAWKRRHRLSHSARKQQAGIISTRRRLFAAIAALLLIAVIGLGFFYGELQQLNSEQQQLNTQQQQLNTVQSTDLASLSNDISTIEQSLNPYFNATSSAITIAVHNSDWVLTQKPEHLTIELYGSHSKSEAFNFIRQVQPLLIDPVSYVKTEHRGRDWYVVLYGNYITAGESQAIISVLREVLRQHNPPVGQFGWVQQQL